MRARKVKAFLALLLCTAMAVPGAGNAMTAYASKPEKQTEKEAAVEIRQAEEKEQTVQAAQPLPEEGEERPLSPQMGWSTWNFFREQVDEEKVLDAAAAMKESGLVDAGYVYLNMDDCWQSSMRDPETGSMMFDLDNFPSGPELVDKLHDMGLKVGVYSSSGELTCEDLPGSYGNEAVDARAFAEWGIDYLKYDYCHVVDLSSDPEGGSDFSGLTSAPDVDYISLTKYTGSDGASGDKVRIEAESDEVERTGNVTVQSSGSCSGGQYVTGLSSNGGSLIFKNVNAPEDGTYILTIGYRKTYSLRGRYAEVLVNDSDRYEAHVSRSSGWSSTGRHQILVDLKAGDNTIEIHNPITGQTDDSIRRYTNMGNALQSATEAVAAENGTEERPIFFSICEHGRSGPWNWAAGIGNSWRTSGDISANWNSVVNNYESSVSHWDKQVPGSYNDPDMLQVGNGSLTDVENQSHFTLWSMLSAPLILGNDVRDFVSESGEMSEKAQKIYDIVTNEDIIALNQDLPLLQCKRISTANGMDILVKPLQNQETGKAEVAVCFFNKTGADNSSASVDLGSLGTEDSRLADLGWQGAQMYRVKNLWTGEEKMSGNTLTSGSIPSHGVEVYHISAAEIGDIDKMAAVSVNAESIYPAEGEGTVEVEVTNMGTTDIENLTVSLDGGEDIKVDEEGSEKVDLKTGETAVATFHITLPEMKSEDKDAYVDTYELNALAEFNYAGESELQESTASDSVMVSEPVGAQAGAEVKLGDAAWLSSTSGWDSSHPSQRNQSIEHNPITIAGEEFESGIGVHASSDTQIYVGGQDCVFSAVVGIDDEMAGYEEQWAPSVTFIVLADGKEAYRTDELKFGKKQDISVELRDCQILTLRADMGASNSSDHADWGDAALTFGSLPEVYAIQISSSAGGTVVSDPEGTVSEGGDVTLTFTPDSGYELKSAEVNGTDVIAEAKETGTYVIEDVKEDITVTAEFQERIPVPEDKEVVSVNSPEAVAAYGIPQDALELPMEVTAVLKDGSEAAASVTSWECGDYQPWTEGTYTFTGTLAESESYTNPADVKAEVAVEVKLPSENIAPLAQASAPEGASAIQGGVEKQPGWVNDGVYDDQGREENDGVYAFATPLTENSYFDLVWENPTAVDRIVLNTYFADEQGPTAYEVWVQYEGSDEWKIAGSQEGIEWPVHNGRDQYQSEIVFSEPLENVTAMRVKVTDTNSMWGVSVITEFEVYGRELCQVTVDPQNGEEPNTYYAVKGSYLDLQDPVREGYGFEGWYTDETCETVYEPAPVEAPLHLYAKWSRAYSVTIGEMSHGTVKVNGEAFAEGDTVTLSVEPEEGYQLKAGTLKANDTVIEGTEFVMPAEDVVVTAEFEKTGGGDGPEDPSSPEDPEDPDQGNPTDPDDPKDPGNSNGNNSGAGSKGDGGNNAVKTGDTTSASVYVLAAGLALAAAGAVCVKRKKNR